MRKFLKIISIYFILVSTGYAQNFKIEKILDLKDPWSLTFINKDEVLITEKEPELSKKEQNIVWLASSCVEAGYSSIKDSDVQRIPALKNKVTNAININENELKKYEGRKGFEEWSEKGKKQAKAYSAMEKGILIANACLL